MSQYTGKVTIKLDGKKLPTESRATFNPGGDNRDPERHGGKTYWSAEEVPPLLQCTVMQTRDFDAVALSDITNATVTFIADTGQKFMMRDAFTTKPVEFNGSGKAPLEMSGEAERI